MDVGTPARCPREGQQYFPQDYRLLDQANILAQQYVSYTPTFQTTPPASLFPHSEVRHKATHASSVHVADS